MISVSPLTPPSLPHSSLARTEADSRHDKQPDQYAAEEEAGRHDTLAGEESGAEERVTGQGYTNGSIALTRTQLIWQYHL